MPTVTVNPGGQTFNCEGKQTILEAALSASVSLNYGCRTGTCGLCMARLQQGKIEKVRHFDFTLREADKLNGDFLLCAHTAVSPNVVIQAFEAAGSSDIPWQSIDAKIRKLDRINDHIGILTVQTPRTRRLRFLAGQNVRLHLPSNATADLPIASCPCDDRNIEFHLRCITGDAFSAELFGSGSFPAPIHIEGPWGPDPGGMEMPYTLCLAFDTGFAPLRSWMEQQLAKESPDRIKLYWFNYDESDFYLINLLDAWSDAFDTFDYHLSTRNNGEQISAVLEPAIESARNTAFEHSRILLAGPEPFQDEVHTLLRTLNFPESSLFIHTTTPGNVEFPIGNQ